MIGPSAPNGPPVPIAIAAEIGLAIAVRMATRLCLVMHRLHRLGDAVAADHRGHLGHQADQDRPDDRRQHDRPAHVKFRHGPFAKRDVMEQGDVGDQADEADQHPRRSAPGNADHCRDEAQQQQAAAWRSRNHARQHIVARYVGGWTVTLSSRA